MSVSNGAIDYGYNCDDEIELIFKRRDEKRRLKELETAIAQSSPNVDYPKPGEITSSERQRGRYERTPDTDVFVPSSTRKSSGGKRLARKGDYGRHVEPAGRSRSKSATAKHRHRKGNPIATTVIGLGAAASLLAGGIGFATHLNSRTNGKATDTFDTKAPKGTSMVCEIDFDESLPDNVVKDRYGNYIITIENPSDTYMDDAGSVDSEAQTTGSSVADKNYDTYLEDEQETLNETGVTMTREALSESLEAIFEEDPESLEAFDDFEDTYNNMKAELGQEPVAILRDIRDKYAPNVPLTMMFSVLEQESVGRMHDEHGNLLVGAAGDTGFGQITQVCEDDANGRLNPDGKIRRKEDPYDNLEIMAITLQNLCSVWGYDINGGDNDANRNAIALVLSSYNTGEGGVRQNGIRQTYVNECYGKHMSYLIKYPEFAEYFDCIDNSKN